MQGELAGLTAAAELSGVAARVAGAAHRAYLESPVTQVQRAQRRGKRHLDVAYHGRVGRSGGQGPHFVVLFVAVVVVVAAAAAADGNDACDAVGFDSIC